MRAGAPFSGAGSDALSGRGVKSRAAPKSTSRKTREQNIAKLVRAAPPPNLWAFDNIDVRFDEVRRALWCLQKHPDRPNYTRELLADLLRVLDMQREAFTPWEPGEDWGFRYWVFGSATPGIFNLGGDLRIFVEHLRKRDREGMFEYAKSCVDACYTNYINNNLPIISLALVNGDALGGGLEAAISCDVVIAERGVKLGFPEILFGLFPGMGAYTFLARKIGAPKTEALMTEARIYTADEMQDIGVVDIVVDQGEGETAVHDYIKDHDAKFRAMRSIYNIRKLTSRVEYDEMIRVAQYWVETAMGLRDADLRKMERLARAQDRRNARTVA